MTDATSQSQTSQSRGTVMATAIARKPLTRSTRKKKAHRDPSFVDSSTLLIGSDDDGDDNPQFFKKAHLEGNSDAEDEQSITAPGSEDLSSSEDEGYYQQFTKVDKKSVKYVKPHARQSAVSVVIGTKRKRSPALYVRTSLIVVLPLPKGSVDKNAFYDSEKKGFMDLPGELRNEVYKFVFTKDTPINFANRSGFSHSSAFLRVNKTVHKEARELLYGTNRFFLKPDYARVGDYWIEEWTWVGYSHVRRFLTDIGPDNVSLIRYIGMAFLDASPSCLPGKGVGQRRFEHNEDLTWIVEHLGKYGMLKQIKLGFGGRQKFWILPNHPNDFTEALLTLRADLIDIDDDRYVSRYQYPQPPLSLENDDWCISCWDPLRASKIHHTAKAKLLTAMTRHVPLSKSK